MSWFFACASITSLKKKKKDFPGGPVVKAPHFHCRGCGFGL